MSKSKSKPMGKPRRVNGPAGIAVIVLTIAVFATVLERVSRPSGGGETLANMPMPPLLVEGWVNTADSAAPSVESLRGKWVVVDSWATYCGPCLASMPHLAEFYQQWQDQGVAVVGLTSEPASLLPQIESVLARIDGADWPVAYGAGMVNSQLGVSAIPTYTLFTPDGRGVWQGHRLDDLEAELKRQMAASAG